MSDVIQETAAKPVTRKIGLISMGITLVATGVVMLCAQLGWLDPSRYRWLLPAYLIVLGSETLITRLLVKKQDADVRLTPAVGSVAITLGVLLFIRVWVLMGGTGIHTWLYW